MVFKPSDSPDDSDPSLAKKIFSFHPFKQLHSQHLLPLLPSDYMSRFSMELTIFVIVGIALASNISLAHHASLLETSNQSVIFSYLKNNPEINRSLVRSYDTTKILASDKLVLKTTDESPFAQTAMASNFYSGKIELAKSTTIQENVIVKTNPTDINNYPNFGRTIYEVQPGDTIGSIASDFGISSSTVMQENSLHALSVIKPGQQLTILPITGVSHKVTEKDTFASIAAKYKVDEFDLLDANDLELPDQILVGDVLVVPLASVDAPAIPQSTNFVRDTSNQITLSRASAPAINPGNLSFRWPTSALSITQGSSARHRALDISNSRQVPIYASEAGFVESAGWQGAYGNAILINHGNGYKTLYGHASALYVKAGDTVTRGQTIAQQGATGRVRGVTGIHLHFEIWRNGIKQNPLNYVRP
jgi:murein DD-endopeptidase MepM/ murein hydrolase activator NlpD